MVGTSPNYLVQILIELKAAGLVSSVRGKGGGYRLAKAPQKITLGDVWRAVDEAIQSLLRTTSIQDLANRQYQVPTPNMHQI